MTQFISSCLGIIRLTIHIFKKINNLFKCFQPVQTIEISFSYKYFLTLTKLCVGHSIGWIRQRKLWNWPTEPLFLIQKVRSKYMFVMNKVQKVLCRILIRSKNKSHSWMEQSSKIYGIILKKEIVSKEIIRCSKKIATFDSQLINLPNKINF